MVTVTLYVSKHLFYRRANEWPATFVVIGTVAPWQQGDAYVFTEKAGTFVPKVMHMFPHHHTILLEKFISNLKRPQTFKFQRLLLLLHEKEFK
jgi:hypothetical protein